MLSVHNLTKIYHTKTGLSCRALDGINIDFQSNGLVFILGKSGSGKSTLLNVVGGLDAPDHGEIVIADKSSKDFDQQDFDSYRNTYVGFIFQEYNILNQFSVGDNIALALELQDKVCHRLDINNILREVGLEGYAQRKIDELSGGQKQRVAIARALIKDPQIIFADEPTGNLDEASGAQIFEFLCELAKTKLIVVVSHDREAANIYADRIIELSDGKIISDITRSHNIISQFEVTKSSILIPKNRALTSDELLSINSENQNKTFSFAQENKFNSTKTVVVDKTIKFGLVKSKLPKKAALKIATSNNANKKGRLIVTILLIVIAISMFGFTEILARYNMTDSSISSFNKADITNIMVRQGKTSEYLDYFERSYDVIEQQKIDDIRAKYSNTTFSKFIPTNNIPINSYNTGSAFMPNSISGLLATSKDALTEMGFNLIGKFPSPNTNQVVISDFLVFMLMIYNREIFDVDDLQFGAILAKLLLKTDYDDKTTYKTEKYTYDDVKRVIDNVFKYANYDQLEEDIVLLGLIMDEFTYELLKVTNTFNIAGGKFTFTGVVRTRFEKYINMLTLTASELKKDERSIDIMHLINNYYNVFYVDESFVDIFYRDQVALSNHYVLNLERANGDSSLKNVNVIYNSEWLLAHPGKELAPDEIVISDNYFTLIFGGGEKFDPTRSINDAYNPLSKSPYIFNYEPKNNKLDYTKDKFNLKIVGTFNYYETIKQNSSSVAISNRPIYINSSMNMVMVANNEIVSKSAQIMSQTGALYFHMPNSYLANREMLNYLCNSEPNSMLMYHNSAISELLYVMNDTIFILQTLFKYLSYILGAFSILLLANFMTTSVYNKKRDIGVLRALGATSADVSKIFLIESGIIGAITIFFSCLMMTLMTFAVNALLRTSFIKFFKNVAVDNLTLLTLSIMPYVIVILVSALIVTGATIIPARKISKLKPIDAIKKSI